MIRLLYFTAEPHPTARPDIADLFGNYLPSHGVCSDLVSTQSNNNANDPWPAGKAIVAAKPASGVRQHLVKFWHLVTTAITARRSDYAAFQVRDMPFQALFVLLIARLRRIPFLYWCSYPFPEAQIERAKQTRSQTSLLAYWLLLWRGRIGRWLLYRVVMAQADHVFVQSEQMRADLRHQGIASIKMTSVPMGVDLAAVAKVQTLAPPNLDQENHRILVYLGNMERERQVEELFKTLALLRHSIPNVKLVLVGGCRDSKHEHWLRQQALSAGVSNLVHWTGWLPRTEAWRYVASAELGFSLFPRGPLLDSASPTKMAEYLALGVPVVCNDNPDQQRLVEKSQGGICVAYSAEKFAEAATTLLQEDANQRQQRIEKGKRFIAVERDYEVIAKRVAKIYLGICEGRRISQVRD